jgi:hypothetical protein
LIVICAALGPPLKVWNQMPGLTDFPQATVAGSMALTKTSAPAVAGIPSANATAITMAHQIRLTDPMTTRIAISQSSLQATVAQHNTSHAEVDVPDYGPEDRATPELAAEERESADRVAMIGQITSVRGQPIPGIGAAPARLSRELFEREYGRQLLRDCKSRASVNGDAFVLLGDPGTGKAALPELTGGLASAQQVRVPSGDHQIAHGKHSPRHDAHKSRPQARASS